VRENRYFGSTRKSIGEGENEQIETSLPPNFAEKVLELEMNVQSDTTDVASIEGLISLYSVSIIC
jgi:hypothetical protein